MSAKMKARKEARAKHLDDYFRHYSWEVFNDIGGVVNYKAQCQLCGFAVTRDACDFAHKVRASQLGLDIPENAVCLHRACHTWSHAHRDVEDAITDSPANLLNGELVRLSDQRRLDLYAYLGFANRT